MSTPKYDLPEMISGSLTMQAYNDRLAFLETLLTEIEATGIYNQQDVSQLVNNKIQIVSDTPTNSVNNWYQNKAGNFHLQVDNIAKFLTSFAKLATKVKYKNCKYFEGKYLLHPTSSQTITYINSTSTTTNNTLRKYNYLSNATTGNTVVLQADPVVNGLAYVINTGTNSTNLCLNNILSGSCSIIGAGKVKQVIVKNGVLSLFDPFAIPTQGLTAYWLLGESGSSLRLDSSGNGNNLSPNFTFTSTPSGKLGFGNAIVFTGFGKLTSNNGVSQPINLASNFTVTFWIKLTATPAQKLFVTKFDSATNYGFQIKTGDIDGSTIAFSLQTSGSIKTTLISNSVTTNVWHFVTVTHEATTKTMSLTVNRGAVSLSSTVGNNPYTFNMSDVGVNTVVGGDHSSTSGNPSAHMIKARTYNRVLSNQELDNLYNES
jgi:hypothetical protein